MLGYASFRRSMIDLMSEHSDPIVSSSNCAIQFENLVVIGQGRLSLVL